MPLPLQPHQQRVLDELQQLTERREKLAAFIEDNPIFLQIPTDEQMRLREQNAIMRSYEDVLKRRIAAWTPQ